MPSVRAHLAGRDGPLVTVKPVLDLVPRFADLLSLSPSQQQALNGFETLSPMAGRSAIGNSSPTPSVNSAGRFAAESPGLNLGPSGPERM